MIPLKNTLSASVLAGTIALTGCGKESEQVVTMVETAQKCESILFGLANNCITNAEVRGINLTGTSTYSIAGKAGKENDAGSRKSTNVPNNIEFAIKTIEYNIREQVDKSSPIITDVVVNRRNITLIGKADGTASYIGNMESGKYIPGFGALDSAKSNKSIEDNKINAEARCNDTINSIGKNIAPNVNNQVNCEGVVIPFTNEELDILLSIGGWLLEYKQEFRGKNVSPAIIAFSYIKGLESGKIKNEITDNVFNSNLDKAIKIVKSKHFVNIEGVKANIGVEIEQNKISNLGIGMTGGLLGGISIAGFLAGFRRKRNK